MHQAQPILLTYEGSKRRSLCQPSDPEFSDWTLVPESDGFRFELKQGHCPSCAVGVMLDLPDWGPDDHLHIPAAIYAGNRFECRPLSYSPRTPEADAGPDTPTLITDVPRLDVTAKQSVIRLREGDCSFPCIAVYQPRTRQGLLFGLLPNQDAEGALHVEEDLETGNCRLMLTVPGVREEKRYSHCNTQTFSGDRGRAMSAGDHLSIRYRLQSFDCHSVTELLEHLFAFREEVYAEAPARPQLPWSEAFARVEGHYNRDFWQERARLYLCTMPEDFYPWQLGWCGGLIATWPLLASGREESRERAQRNLEQVATRAVRPSGLLFGRANLDGEFTYDFPDDIARSWTKTWHLVRRDADVLFFGVQQWKLLQKRGEKMPALREMLTGLADAYVRVWRENGQLGQFLDTETAQIAVGNSCSGALIPAGFIRVAEAFDRPDLIPLAAEIAAHYVETFLSKGFTTGGPGDALQNPDSESCAALLESLVLLYRKTGESRWLAAATQCAHLLSTWVMPGRYAFPAGSEFYRLDIETPGTVFANTQNKHSAPGLCTLSGEALLQLYRCSGDVRFLRLLESIARALPQCISLKERPIHFPCGGPLPDGWINERVNTSDWDFNVGGVFEGPCWSEVSMMLTTLELPGIYVNTSNGDLACFDHVIAEWDAGSGRLHIQNPTLYPATVTVWMDAPEQPEDCWEKITLAPGEKTVLT